MLNTKQFVAKFATFITSLCLLLAFGCSKPDIEVEPVIEEPPTEEEIASKNIGSNQRYYGTSSWASGNLSSSQIVDPNKLKHVTLSLGGGKKWVSNNPEVFRGNGWLMQNAGRAGRGGHAYPLSGWNGLYLFHINKSGSTKYLHVLVTNPNSSSITAYGVGSMFTNSQYPLNGKGTGPCYMVAKNWLTGNHSTKTGSVSIAPYKAYEMAKIVMYNNNMIDGRFELHTSAGAYIYTVVTSTGNTADAINLSQGSPASGDLAYAGSNTYGREAGIYKKHNVSGTIQTDLPTYPAHIGFCLNTNAKFNSNLQEQTAPYDMLLTGSALRTYGNYGHKYNYKLELRNTSSASRRVRVSFASNVTSGTLSMTYNGPFNYNGSLKDIYTTPTYPKQVLGDFWVAAGSTKIENITFFVPGLITTNHQIIVETL